MSRLMTGVGGLLVGAALTVFAVNRLRPAPPVVPPPDGRAVVEKIRDVARLETLEVHVYRKVSFEQEAAKEESTWKDLANWLKTQVHPVRGRAIVFGVAHVQLDVDKLQVHLRDRTIYVVLPPTRTHVELKPQETEIMSNEHLGPEQTSQMLALAKAEMEREVAADKRLQERAVTGAQRAIRAVLADAGLVDVRFVSEIPTSPPST